MKLVVTYITVDLWMKKETKNAIEDLLYSKREFDDLSNIQLYDFD